MPIPLYWTSGVQSRRWATPRRQATEAEQEEQEEQGQTPTEGVAEGMSLYRRSLYAIVALTTIAIASTELGTAYTSHERRLYTSAVFQCVAMLAVLQIMLEDFDARWPLAIFGLWAALKYGGRLFPTARPSHRARRRQP